MTSDTNEQHIALVRGTEAERFICSGEFVTLFPQRATYEGDLLTAEIRSKYGLFPELLCREALVERDPNIGPLYNFATVFKDFCWLSSPGGYVAALFSHFLRNGGLFRQSRVVSIKPGTRPSLVLEGGETLSGDKIVLASGAWSGKMARAFGVPMKLEAERGYHVVIPSPEFTAPQPYLATDAKIILTPMDGFLRAAGIVEFGGLDAPAASQPIELIRKGIRKVYPTLNLDVTGTWMGRRPTGA